MSVGCSLIECEPWPDLCAPDGGLKWDVVVQSTEYCNHVFVKSLLVLSRGKPSVDASLRYGVFVRLHVMSSFQMLLVSESCCCCCPCSGQNATVAATSNCNEDAVHCCKNNIPAVDARLRDTTRLVPTRRQKIVSRTLWAVLATGPEESKLGQHAGALGSGRGCLGVFPLAAGEHGGTHPEARLTARLTRPAPPEILCSRLEATLARLHGGRCFAARGGPGRWCLGAGSGGGGAGRRFAETEKRR